MTDDPKARFEAIKAENAEKERIAAERRKADEKKAADFVLWVDAVFGPIFRAKADALHRDDDPVRLGPRAMYYRKFRLSYTPAWNQTRFEIGGSAVYEQHREQTRGHYVFLQLTKTSYDPRRIGDVETTLRSVDLRWRAREEPFLGRVMRYETISLGDPYEGSRVEHTRINYRVEPISQTSDAIVQDLVEAMVRHAAA